MKRRVLLVTAALCVSACVLAPTAPATTKAIWGPILMPDGSSAFPVYRDLGVDVFQIQLGWADVAPTRPQNPSNPNDPAYAWSPRLTEAVRQARARGIEVAMLVKGSPSWANGGRGPQWAPSNRAYAQFLTAASRKYRAVRRWMIWGEVNRAAVFQPLPTNGRAGPRRYATLLRAAYKALKRRSRKNIVIGGMTFTFGEVMPRDFLRFMRLPNGKPPPLDQFGHNPFSRRFPNLRLGGYRGFPASRDISDVDRFAKEIHRAYGSKYRRFRRKGPKLWLSEFTVSSDQPNRAFTFAVSRREQARWLRAAFRIARKSYISGLGWFNLLDEPVGRSGHLTQGLITYEGQRKPAYKAYKRAR
jgi:hypothetical protein